MGNKNSSNGSHKTKSTPPVRAPKHMLWGCETPEEHHEYVKKVCDKVANLQGEEGLREMGFEFQMYHSPETCTCELSSDDSDHGRLPLNSDDDDDEWRLNYNNDESDDNSVSDEHVNGETYMVPIGTPLNGSPPPENNKVLERSMTSLMESTIDRLSHQDNMGEEISSKPSSRPVSRSASAVSMFSLATHYTQGSNTASGARVPGAIDAAAAHEEDVCALRLYHTPSGTLLTNDNHVNFMAHGKMYDEVARLCMEHAQEVMVSEGNLEWVSVCDARGIRALVSKDRGHRKKVLLVVTGKGKVRAGIFSRRHLMTTSMESSTALPLVREAVRRDMDVVMLDPNALTDKMGMDVVEASLERLFLDNQMEEEEIYVLAHSMAGAQLVRFLHTRSSTGGDDSNNAKEEDDKATESFVRNIKAVAFTDSNHNINWTKTNPSLTNLLVGPSCLYIKSHKPHEEAKPLGELHHDCKFWRHRFGSIRTLWAGTHEHALTNHTARHHIWDHFDSFLHPQRQVTDDGNDKQQEEETSGREPTTCV